VRRLGHGPEEQLIAEHLPLVVVDGLPPDVDLGPHGGGSLQWLHAATIGTADKRLSKSGSGDVRARIR
jgi:hypothetical protein